jgi:hypothetical protein
MNRPGAIQVGYLKKLIESRPMLNRIPDNTLILKGQADKAEHIEAFRAADNSYAMIYIPVGKTITISTSNFQKQITAWWFNPKDAKIQKLGVFENKGSLEFVPPTLGVGNDWVLIIDDPAKKKSNSRKIQTIFSNIKSVNTVTHVISYVTIGNLMN